MSWSVSAVALGLIILATGYLPLYAGEPAAKISRLGVVYTISPSAVSVGYTIDFWERLRELGWIRGKNLLVEDLTRGLGTWIARCGRPTTTVNTPGLWECETCRLKDRSVRRL